MVLEHQRLLRIVFLIRLRSDVESGPLDLNVILNEYAIVNDRHVAWRYYGSVLGKARSAKENVVALPLTRLAARVDHRDVLLVDARSLAVRVSAIVIGIEHLNFVPSLKKHSAISALLAFAFDL